MGAYIEPGHSDNIMWFHIVTLTFTWNFVINVSLFFAIYKYQVYGYYVHAALGWLGIVLTLIASLFFIVPHGLKLDSNTHQPLQIALAVLGLVLLVWITFQVAFGVFARLWQQYPFSRSITVIRSKQFHQWSGYFMMTLGKANCLIHWRDVHQVLYSLIAWQIVSLSSYFYLKNFYKTLEQKIIDPQIKEMNIPKIRSLQQLKNSKNQYVIYSDYVYEIWPLKTLHPAGYQIIDAVKGRQVDRFVYGMYSAQLLPQVAPYSHSVNSFKLIGQPLAKIQLPSPIKQIEDLNQCVLIQRQLVSQKTKIYIFGFKFVNNKKIKYEGISQLAQIGQYFSVTINDKITRLYTSVYCMFKKNIKLMEQISQYQKNNLRVISFAVKNDNEAKIRKQQSKLQCSFDKNILDKQKPPIQNLSSDNRTVSIGSDRNIIQQNQNQNHYLPLLIKVYKDGKLTPLLQDINNIPKSIMISRPRGQGLKLQYLQKGTVIFLAGGTGLYPFIDVIDLLFKQQYIKDSKCNYSVKKQLIENDPILEVQYFIGFKFKFWVAIQSEQDVHSLTLFQCNYLAKKNNCQFVFKVKKKTQSFQKKYQGISLIDERFDKMIIPQAKKQQTQKIYICGPPAMNTSIIKAFTDNNILSEKYQMV